MLDPNTSFDFCLYDYLQELGEMGNNCDCGAVLWLLGTPNDSENISYESCPRSALGPRHGAAHNLW